MNVDEIKNGVVIDHIKAGQGMEIYRFLELDKLDCPIAIIKNASSRRMGRKDIIKVDTENELDLSALGY
ncbi:MAG: aspartate carbamoyltransferase regulatory subunit, partial [Clostridia bacterium]|nr:aspartate carbamoyltransferase regulatory subunit [Clostridia bacterium]